MVCYPSRDWLEKDGKAVAFLWCPKQWSTWKTISESSILMEMTLHCFTASWTADHTSFQPTVKPHFKERCRYCSEVLWICSWKCSLPPHEEDQSYGSLQKWCATSLYNATFGSWEYVHHIRLLRIRYVGDDERGNKQISSQNGRWWKTLEKRGCEKGHILARLNQYTMLKIFDYAACFIYTLDFFGIVFSSA